MCKFHFDVHTRYKLNVTLTYTTVTCKPCFYMSTPLSAAATTCSFIPSLHSQLFFHIKKPGAETGNEASCNSVVHVRNPR